MRRVVGPRHGGEGRGRRARPQVRAADDRGRGGPHRRQRGREDRPGEPGQGLAGPLLGTSRLSGLLVADPSLGPPAAASRCRSPAATRPCRRPPPPTGSRSRPAPGASTAAFTTSDSAMFCAMVRRAARPRATSGGSRPRSSDMRAMSAVSRAASVPRPASAIPTSAVASAGASLTPSPTIATRPDARRLSRKALDLVLGQEIGGPGPDPDLGGDHPRRPLVVAGQHRRLDPERPQRAPPPPRPPGARRRRPRSRPPCARGSSTATSTTVLPSPSRRRSSASRRWSQSACSSNQRWLPTRTMRPSDAAAHAAAGSDGDVDRRAARLSPRRRAWATSASPTGCAPRASTAAASRRTSAAVAALEGDHVGDVRLAAGQRPRLVEDDLADAADLLEVRAALDQHSAPATRR